MRRISLFVALVAGSMLATGCGWQPSGQQAARGGLAVIDLDLMAKTCGRTMEINDALKTRESALNQQLQQGLVSLRKQIEDKKTEFGESPTEEQQQTLAAMDQKAVAMLQQARREAQVKLEQYRQNLVAQFRNEVRPWAQQVAAEKGLSVVIPKNEGFLLSVDPGVDITADVIKVYQAKKPAPATQTAAVPAPVKPTKPASTAEATPETETR